MTVDKNTTFKEYLQIAGVVEIDSEKLSEFYSKIKDRALPEKISGVTVPKNLNGLLWHELISLQSKTSEDAFFNPFSVLLGIDKEKVLDCRLFDVLGFVFFVNSELERIAKLFDKIKHSPTPEEVRAGINNLNFGMFGTLDWYCRRMGITDHGEGEKTPWVRIYKCLEMDNKTANYERNLRTILSKK